MALNCLENVNTPSFVWFEGGNKRHAYVSILAGFFVSLAIIRVDAKKYVTTDLNFLQFFLGWWIVIDVEVSNPKQIAAGHVCGVLGTLSLIIVNSISNSQITNDAYDGGRLGARGAKAFLFFGFVLGFASIIGGSLFLVANLIKKDQHWPGVGLFLQNALIFIASLIYKFGRSEDQW